MYKLASQIRSDLAGLKESMCENVAALDALRTHTIGLSQDIQNFYAILTRHDARLERIERRLHLVEAT